MRAANQRNLTFGGQLSLEFSEVSQQGSKEIEAWAKEQAEVQLGWSTFHTQKCQIQKLKRELFSCYLGYRKNHCETLRQFCLQSANTFDYSKLLAEQAQLSKKEELIYQQVKDSNVQQKQATIQKIISQRRIKRYYKTKHQINYQDQLDPEDDQKQIYKIYQDAFLKDKRNDATNTYNQQFQPQNTRISQFPPSRIQRKASPSFIDLSDARNQYPQEAMLSRLKPKNNYLKVNDPFVGFQPDLSFESKNEHYYPANNQIFDSFAINIIDKYDTVSEGGKQTKNKVEKDEDQLSHRDNLYKNFVEKQNQQLQKQKMRVQQLTDKAYKVLNNGEIEQEESMFPQKNQEQDKVAKFRYLLGQIIETFSVCQVLKFLIKFKSFEVLNKLYQHASQYYGELIEFQEPIKANYMSQIVLSTMPEQQEQGINVVIQNLFGGSQEISFQEFLERLTPGINQLQYKIIQESSISSHAYKSLDLAIRLFTVWIELDYFQNEIKKLLEQNQNIVQRFIAEVTQDGIFSILKICDFMSKSKKNKLRKLKTEIFFRKIIGHKLNLSQFYRWINTRKVKRNPATNIEEVEPKYQFYYNLY